MITKEDAIMFSFLKWQKLANLVRKYRHSALTHKDKIDYIKVKLLAAYPFLGELRGYCGLCERFKETQCKFCYFRSQNNNYSCNRLHIQFWERLTEYSARQILNTVRKIAEVNL